MRPMLTQTPARQSDDPDHNPVINIGRLMVLNLEALTHLRSVLPGLLSVDVFPQATRRPITINRKSALTLSNDGS